MLFLFAKQHQALWLCVEESSELYVVSALSLIVALFHFKCGVRNGYNVNLHFVRLFGARRPFERRFNEMVLFLYKLDELKLGEIVSIFGHRFIKLFNSANALPDTYLKNCLMF
jgi:hypothetical protein